MNLCKAVSALAAGCVTVGRALGLVVMSRRRAKEPWQILDEKAHTAKNHDPTSIRALADEIFRQTNGFFRLPSSIEEPLKERLVRAELAYRAAEGKGVVESNVVRMINQFATRLTAPDCARTSELQVRDLRIRSLGALPHFMGYGVTIYEDGSGTAVGASLAATMSPLQAAYLTLVLIKAKLVNSYYQVDPQQWDARLYEEALRKWHADQAQRALEKTSRIAVRRRVSHRLEVGPSNPKRKEITETLQRTIATLGFEEALSLAREGFDILELPW